jgi:hypothetical protein
MMLTMAMPAMKRSDLIMALVPLRLPSPTVSKKIRMGPSVGFLKIRRSDPEARERIFLIPSLPRRPPGAPGGSPWRGEGDFCGLLRFALCRWWRFRCPRDQLTTRQDLI